MLDVLQYLNDPNYQEGAGQSSRMVMGTMGGNRAAAAAVGKESAQQDKKFKFYRLGDDE